MAFAENDYCGICDGPWDRHWLMHPEDPADADADWVVFCPDDVTVNKWDGDPDECGVALVGRHWYDMEALLPRRTSPSAATWLLDDLRRRVPKGVLSGLMLHSVAVMDSTVRRIVGADHVVGASTCDACPPGWPATHCSLDRPTVHAIVVDRYAHRALTGNVNWLEQGGLRSVFAPNSHLRVDVVCEVCSERHVTRDAWKQVRAAASEHPQWVPTGR